MEHLQSNGVRPRLVDLINGMTEEQCERLFHNLQTTEDEEHENGLDPSYVKKHPRRDFFMEKRIDRRYVSRVDCHCPVYLAGNPHEKMITDLSLGGVFIECDSASRNQFSPGELVHLSIKFPTEQEVIKVPAQIVNHTDRGMNCQFVYLNGKMEDAIHYCYSMTKYSVPGA